MWPVIHTGHIAAYRLATHSPAEPAPKTTTSNLSTRQNYLYSLGLTVPEVQRAQSLMTLSRDHPAAGIQRNRIHHLASRRRPEAAACGPEPVTVSSKQQQWKMTSLKRLRSRRMRNTMITMITIVPILMYMVSFFPSRLRAGLADLGG
jgi:hypothetical protein